MFKKAERKQAKLKMLISGPSGSGKTYSALRMAVGIGGKIAVIDSENGSASLYADKFNFDTVSLSPPFTAQKYVEAIDFAESAGYSVIVVDSFSHAWAGEGGTLDQKSDRDARGGNHYTNWRDPKSAYQRVKNALLHSPCHIVATVRAKQAYVLVEEGGKQKPQKMGMDPIAEPNLEYEFTAVLDIAMDHKAKASKDRTELFGDNIEQITEKTGEKLLTWLNSGKPAEAASQTIPAGVKPLCLSCKAELLEKELGYVCPNSKAKGDGHVKILKEKLTEYLTRQTA